MNRCGSCKFWGLPDESKAKWRSCTAVIHDDGDATGMTENEGGYTTPVEERGYMRDARKKELIVIRDQHLAVAVDGSGYHAALKTRDSFGCVLYQPRG